MPRDFAPKDFAKVSFAYRSRVWLAVLGLLLFVVVYIGLASWFTYTTYRMIIGMTSGGDGAVAAFFTALPAGFLAIFMWKAIFFFRHGSENPGLEITADEQPELFEFMHKLADELHAPRPHRVFVAPDVNAAVFYDLSILNFFFSSKKNLTIGLGLVNVLNRSEFTAVLAHEFGHFAQRSMALGRWVYVGEQVAGHIIAKRDLLDRGLDFISSIDLRVAWIGWIMRTVVWSIRSLMESVFRWVVIAHHALSREMEFQADLMAISVTGSDALVHALYRIQSADEDWDGTLEFANRQLAKGNMVPDLFAVQTRIGEHLRRIMNEPQRGIVPEFRSEEGSSHRLFTEQIAQPPRMWSTHPPNTLREENAKRVYLPSQLEEASAWTLFQDPMSLREAVTEFLFSKVKLDKPPERLATDVALAELDKQYSVESFDPAYQGAYIGRLVTIGVAQADQMCGTLPTDEQIAESLQALYPESLHDAVKELQNLEKEITQLTAIEDRHYEASEGVIRHRGEEIQRADLSRLIVQVKKDRDEILAKIEEHDRKCRTVHAAAAQSVGYGWQAYLRNLRSLLHYAEQSGYDLNDAHAHLANTTAMATAAGRVSSRKLKRILQSANDLQAVMTKLDEQTEDIELPSAVMKDLEVETWREAIDKLELPPADNENVSQWMTVVDSWANPMKDRFAALRRSVLGELLKSEKYVAQCFLGQAEPEPIPKLAVAPKDYPTRPRGSERKQQTRLDWWSRFTLADGTGHGIARFVVATTVVAAVVVAGLFVGDVSLVIYNGLSTPVRVTIGNQEVSVAPFRHTALTMGTRQRSPVVARTQDGRLVESFEGSLTHAFATYVYNVAGAAPLVESTRVYGDASPVDPTLLGCPRWRITTVDHIFTKPPEQIKTSDSGGTRTVLSSDVATINPMLTLRLIDDQQEQERVIQVHALWDSADSRYITYWLHMASELGGLEKIVSQRLAFDPGDVPALRLQKDGAEPEELANVLKRHREAAQKHPDDPDWQYIGIRSLPDGPEQDRAFLEAYEKWPDNIWLSNAAGYAHARNANWKKALDCSEPLLKQFGPVFDSAAMKIARIRRLLATNEPPSLNDLQGSFMVNQVLQLESGETFKATPLYAYSLLNKGQVEEAYRVAGGDEVKGHLLVLLAASAGAKKEWRQRALQIPTEEIQNPSLLLYLSAVAFRDGQPFERYLEEAEKLAPEKPYAPIQFLKTFIKQGGPPASLEDELNGLDPTDRGLVLSIAIIMNPEQAKESWRKSAKALLFATERPAL